MAATDVRVLNLGADRDFKRALEHVTGVVRTISVTSQHADVDVVTTRMRSRIAGTLTDRIGLLHVMGHGAPNGEIHAGSRVFRWPKVYTLEELRDWVDASGQPLHVDGLLMDACDTYSREWLDGVAAVIGARRSAVYIGTTRPVGWDEASTYTGAFYAALLRDRFPSQPKGRRLAFLDAHKRAVRAYRALRDEPAPFKAAEIRR